MWREANQSAELLAKRLGKIGVAGSDSHTLSGVGMTFTQVPGSRTVDEFFMGLARRATESSTANMVLT